MRREKAQAAQTARPKVPIRRLGADCSVVVMKRGNARGAKGAGHRHLARVNRQREEPDDQWKAAAFARWHEPDELRGSSPVREAWECRAAQISAKAMSASKFWTSDDRTPRGHRERHAKKEWSAKARNHPRVASALPHSEGIAYKQLCGEIAMCSRVGRMGSIK